mmetsp:Transcript_33739/g.81699  ORF Transcript_33739/g.81699 Transcript_33739/m.81699 type:complete len:283 (+) Transcript_33739:842-1690(+)
MQRQILSLQLSRQPHQTLHDHPLQLPPLLEGARRRQPESAHRPPGPAPRGQSVLALGIDLGVQQVVRVHIRGVLGIRRVSTVPSGYNRVEELLEGLIGILITSHQPHSLNHGVARIVKPGLHALRQTHPHIGLLVAQAVVDARVRAEGLRHKAAVLGDVRHLLRALVTWEGCSLLRANVLRIPAPELDPLGQLAHSLGQAMRGVVLVHGGAGRRGRAGGDGLGDHGAIGLLHRGSGSHSGLAPGLAGRRHKAQGARPRGSSSRPGEMTAEHDCDTNGIGGHK